MAKGLGLHNIPSNAQSYLASCKGWVSGRRGRGPIYTTVRRLGARLFIAIGAWGLHHPTVLRTLCTVVALLAACLAFVAGVLHDSPFALICLVVAALMLLVAYGGAVSIEPDDDMPAPQYRGTDFARDERARTLAAAQRGRVLPRR